MRRAMLFGPYRLDLSAHQLWRGGELISLTPKALDVLAYLIEHAGELVTRDQLFAALWPSTYVDDHALSVQIRDLRKALGDDPKTPTYIETRHRRGYLFKAPVKTLVSASDRTSPPTSELVTSAPALRVARSVPETNYVRSDDLNIAYQVIGEGPVDMVFVMGWVSHLEYFWTEPRFASFLRKLSRFSRLILFDKRGTGLSDRVPLDQLPTLEQRMHDLRAVMQAAGSRRATICGISEGGCMSAVFAATYPEMTAGLIMIGSYAKRLWAPDYPWAPSLEQRQSFLDLIRGHWGGPIGIETRAPSLSSDPEFREWWATYLRMGASPGAALALTQMNTEVDIRGVLPHIAVPALVLHRAGDTCLKVEEGRYLASHIPGSRYVEIPGQDHLPFVGDQEPIVAEIQSFVQGLEEGMEYDRSLATVVVAEFCEPPSASLADVVRALLARFRAAHLCVTDTSVVASFDGPARAVRYACRLQRTLGEQRCGTRIGLHTGECSGSGTSLRGAAVSVATAVQQRAQPGEILVSGTVRDLVAGSGLVFHAAGRLAQPGLGEWQILRTATANERAGQVSA